MTSAVRPLLTTAAIIAAVVTDSVAAAQTTDIITGNVRDRRTQELLPGVTVVLEGTELGAATDAQVLYRLTSVPKSSHNMRASFVGYAPLLRANVLVNGGNANTINLVAHRDEFFESAAPLGKAPVPGLEK